MKIKELMIGDWIEVNEIKSRVFELAYNRVEHEMTIGILDPNNEIYSCYEGYDHIEPIPLTGTILEANGFETRGTRTHYYIKDDYYDMELDEYSDGVWLVSFMSRDYSLPLEQLSMSYVHEFQHFLRFCAIEKDIEL